MYKKGSELIWSIYSNSVTNIVTPWF